jgi:hypothetical protein
LRTGEDAFLTGVQYPFGPGAKRLAEHVAGALIVHRIEIAPDTGPQVGIGCKMINLTAITHCIPDFLRVPNISTRELNSIRREMAYIRSGLLQNPHRFTRFDELIDEVRANKPAAPGNENQKLPPIPSVIPSSVRISRPGKRF